MCTTYVPEAQFAWKDAEGGKVYTNIFTNWPELTFLSSVWDVTSVVVHECSGVF